ncbi:hypothetical protein [Anabaena sp. CCY 9402-a]|uniref:hypothetical protein n=1 Tax=Anabaena sp. CCY 9402-a TaxID=3103867 RepID=UPI0039C72DB8
MGSIKPDSKIPFDECFDSLRIAKQNIDLRLKLTVTVVDKTDSSVTDTANNSELTV